MSTIYHSIIGLPGTGKTTFLASLWHLLDAGEVSTKIVLDKLVGDHTYLNEIAEAWRQCEEVARTSMSSNHSVSIHVRDVSTNQSLVLGFPDLSGEVFVAQLAARSCSEAYVAGYAQNGGILLFVSADRPQDGVTLNDMLPIVGDSAQDPDQESSIEWSPDLVPEQVRLVELLQFLQRPPFVRRRRRIAVVVSAWDLVNDSAVQPSEWLKRELPLLHQFLTSNIDTFEFSVYGVSAQGGDVTGAGREELLKSTPSERIHCVGQGADPHDLTAPIRWLSGEV